MSWEDSFFALSSTVFPFLFSFFPFDGSDGQWSCDTIYATTYGDTIEALSTRHGRMKKG